MSESETQGRIWRGTIDGNLLANIQNYYSSRHPWGMTKALAARLERVEAQLATKDAQLEALTRENNQLLHDASIWRNRAIAAEEELAGASRLMPKGEQALIAGLVGALTSLANEASGFKSMADWTVHGHTNMAVLGLRIDEARAALALAAEEGL